MKPIGMKTKLKRYFEDEEITRAEIAEKTGMTVGYLRNMFSKKGGALTDSAKFKIMRAFPETVVFLLADDADVEQEATE